MIKLTIAEIKNRFGYDRFHEFGLSPYCLNEGRAKSSDTVEVSQEKAQKVGITTEEFEARGGKITEESENPYVVLKSCTVTYMRDLGIINLYDGDDNAIDIKLSEVDELLNFLHGIEDGSL